MTHDYERNGTTTLFAALNVLDGRVIGRCMQRHRHQEFVRFLNAVEAAVPAGRLVHCILDNHATHKHYVDGSQWSTSQVSNREVAEQSGNNTPLIRCTRGVEFRRSEERRV